MAKHAKHSKQNADRTSGAAYYGRDGYGSNARVNRPHRATQGEMLAAGGLDGYSSSYADYPAIGKKKRGKRVAVGILVGLLVVLAVLVGIVAFYVSGINSTLFRGMGESEIQALLGNEYNKPFYALVVGSDSRDTAQLDSPDNASGGDRSDVIMLVRVDRGSKTIHLLSIPRDTPWLDENGSYEKINAAYARNGAAGIISAVEQVSGVDVDHYAHVNFANFQKLVDALGGITVDVPMTVGYDDALTGEYIEVQAGEGRRLNGQEALILARSRHEYDHLGAGDPESIRQGMVRTIMVAIFNEFKNMSVVELPGALSELANCVTTDVAVNNIVDLGLAMRDGTKMYSCTAPYEGDYDAALGGIWLCYQDKEGWEKIIGAIEAGEDPSSVSYVGDTAYIAGTDQTVTIQ